MRWCSRDCWWSSSAMSAYSNESVEDAATEEHEPKVARQARPGAGRPPTNADRQRCERPRAPPPGSRACVRWRCRRRRRPNAARLAELEQSCRGRRSGTPRSTVTPRTPSRAKTASKYNRNCEITNVWGRRGLNHRVCDMGESVAAEEVAGVALAAGAGTRLRPITVRTPKPLCPVGGRPLLDWSLDALATVTGSVAVNAHHGLDQMQEHLSLRPGVHLSIETSQPLGTAGAIGQLRPWLDGRAVLVVNADTWHRADLAAFVAGWDGERVRILSSGPMPFGARSGIVASILPWSRRLPPRRHAERIVGERLARGSSKRIGSTWCPKRVPSSTAGRRWTTWRPT